MIINNTSGGRMGNQLMQLIHLTASAIEYGWKVWDIAFHVKREFRLHSLPNLRVNNVKCLVWLFFRLPLVGVLTKILNRWGFIFLCNHSCRPNKMPQAISLCDKENVVVINCWPYTDYKSLYLHQEKLRKLIAPKEKYINEAKEWIKYIQIPEAILVGVHIRRTDYQFFCDGKHFYGLDFYKEKMIEIQRFSLQKVQFIVCSDEFVEESIFQDAIEHVCFSHHSAMTDFSILSMCDYIIGPPSTFASTASFFGNTKRFTLYTNNDMIESFDAFGVSMIDYDDVHIWKEEEQFYRVHVKLLGGEVESSIRVCNYKSLTSLL